MPPPVTLLAMDLKLLLMLLPICLGEIQSFDYRQDSSSRASIHLDGRSSFSDHKDLTKDFQVV